MPTTPQQTKPGECKSCGNALVLHVDNLAYWYWCECPGCGGQFGGGSTKEKAIAASHRLSPRLTAMEEANREMLAALKMVRERWTFSNTQEHTHSWHDWADCKTAIDAAIAKAKALAG